MQESVLAFFRTGKILLHHEHGEPRICRQVLAFFPALLLCDIQCAGHETLCADAGPAELRACALKIDLALGPLVGMVFVLAGIAFKVSAVPFHMWTPDVYEGAPTPVTALFAIVPKVAAMALLARLLLEAFPGAQEHWMQMVWILSAASMALGAFAGIAQENIKRLMAYSSIGNMGYALIGLVVGTHGGVGSMIVYMTIYMAMSAGVFAIILCMRRNGQALQNISDRSYNRRKWPNQNAPQARRGHGTG